VDLKGYLKLFRARRTLILVCALLGLAAAAAVTLRATPIYQAKTVIFISTDDGGTNVDSAYQGNLFTQQRVKSYSSVVTSPLVLNDVVKQLKLAESPDALAGQVGVSTPLDTVLLNITVKDPQPQRAMAIANATADSFQRVVESLESKGQAASIVTASVVTPADLPGSPVSPRPKLNLLLGLLVGLAVGVAGAVARQTLDTSVKTPEEVRELFDLPTLAVVPYDEQALRHPLIVNGLPGEPRVEAFRQLRTSLQFVDVDRRPRSIVITSAMSGEGKTTTVANLAVSLAAANWQVVLVDADLRRPRLAEYFGLEGAVGLTDVLSGQVPLEVALQTWGPDGRIRILPAGSVPPNPSELLASHQMSELIGRLESLGLTLIDAPPLLPVTDAAVLAPRASGVIIVANSGKVRREQLAAIVTQLRTVKAHLYGAVLNRAKAGRDSYGYGYSGGYYASTPSDAKQSKRQAKKQSKRRAKKQAKKGVGVAASAPAKTATVPAQESAPASYRS
jgi:capsular exopolysaccharide synthesis family protein